MTYINGSLRLNEPATEHRLYLAATELRVHLVDFVFHLLLQQQPPQSPVEELAACPPVQYLLFALQNTQHMFILLLLLLQPFYGPFFQDHPGQPVPEENFWTLWCKGRLTEAETLTIRLGATPAGLTSAHLHHPPIFYTEKLNLTNKQLLGLIICVCTALCTIVAHNIAQNTPDNFSPMMSI